MYVYQISFLFGWGDFFFPLFHMFFDFWFTFLGGFCFQSFFSFFSTVGRFISWSMRIFEFWILQGENDATHRWRRSYLDSRLSKTLCSTNESSEASNVDAAAPHTATVAAAAVASSVEILHRLSLYVVSSSSIYSSGLEWSAECCRLGPLNEASRCAKATKRL